MLKLFRLRTLILQKKFSTINQKSRSNLDTLYEMSKKTKTPFFKIQSHHIEIIDDPLDFYLNIHNQLKKAIYRVSLSSLYLGTGALQRFLMKSLVSRAKAIPSLNITLLFDYNRSLRQQNGESPVKMINNYIQTSVSDRISISLYRQSSSSSKLLGEISGVHHQKIAIFDDTVIIGGANLSHNYFLNRKDRYMKIKQCSQLADYLYDYTKVMQENGYQIIDGVPIQMKKKNLSNHYKLWKFSYTPQEYKQSIQQQQKQLQRIREQKQKQSKRNIEQKKQPSIPKNRNVMLAEHLGTDIQAYSQKNNDQIIKIRDNVRQRLFTTSDQNDVGNQIMDIQNVRNSDQMTQIGQKVYIFPFIQHPKLNERLEPEVFQAVLKNSVDSNIPIKISSGYMNFTKQILQVLGQSKIITEVLCSAPQANSFYRSGRLKKYIPYFYRSFEGNILSKWGQKIKIKQYFDGKWSFHAKGVWIKQNQNNYLTIIGSSNYNKRSKQRDTQLQLYMYSTCQNFNNRLDKQWQNISKDCKQISLQKIKADEQIKYNSWFNFLASIFQSYL